MKKQKKIAGGEWPADGEASKNPREKETSHRVWEVFKGKITHFVGETRAAWW